ncbi:MAG: acyl--CoA ligase, partial [Rubrivivax sp.]|nr:acyl--CoA ligase [Rubrivivax sp.]
MTTSPTADDPRAPSIPLPDLHFLPDLIRRHAGEQPQAPAVTTGALTWDYATLDAQMDRVAAALQRDGCRHGDRIAICAQACNAYVAAFMGALRAGLAVAPLAPSSTPEQIAGMTADAGATHLFLDAGMAAEVPAGLTGAVRRIRLDDTTGGSPGDTAYADWLAPAGSRPAPVELRGPDAFNIIYSSGTTGTPKGIVQSHAMRWAHIRRAQVGGYVPGAVTLIATPLYSNTTLVVVVPTLGGGAHLVMQPKFDCAGYLRLAEAHRATHTMLVPVQYQRLMNWPDFDRHDLSSFRFKACTSAPFRAELKAEVLKRWPGGLTEYYGMTEGGGSCILYCHLHPNKLHTVGQPAEGHDIRLIDEQGRELPRSPDTVGEVVGRSPAMMNGYH